MLHTPAAPLGAHLTLMAPPPHVRCRARTWRVLDMRHDDTTTTWRLAQEAEMPRLIASPPDLVREVRAGRRLVSRRGWMRAALAHARTAAPAWWPASAPRLPVDALAWQFVPAMMILSGHHRRVLLADEVGMGKTVQAGLLLHEIHAREPDAATLVVSPPGLLGQWHAELSARVRVDASLLDAATLRREATQPQAVVDAARGGTCWLVSIDLLRQPDVVELLARTKWTLLVVDEAHTASPATARLAAVARMANASVRVLLLTATPAASGAVAADTLRQIGGRAGEAPMPVLRRAASLLARPARRTCVLQVDLGAAHQALCSLLDGFVARARRESGARGLLPALVLRRRASSCPAALRRSLVRRLTVLGETACLPAARLPGLFDAEPLSDQDATDDEMMRIAAWADTEAERRALERLLALARDLSAAGRKLEAVARLVRRCRQPVVIFTAFLDTLRALRPLLPGTGIVVVHGEQPEALRAEALDAFTSGQASVLLATDAAAEGLNLHARCRLVIHAEVPGSSRSLEQRNGRLDRYGQVRRVHAVVMASRAVEDVEALARLRARAESDEAWMTGATPVGCRRSSVAAQCLRQMGHAVAHHATPTRPDDELTAVPACVLRPRRWRRLSSRLELARTTQAVWAVTLRIAGGPELSASRVPVFVASDDCRAVPELTAAVRRHAVLRRPVTRARRLARRLAAWERETRRSMAATTGSRDAAPGLFSDAAGDPRAPQLPSAPADVWVAVDVASVVTRGAGR